MKRISSLFAIAVISIVGLSSLGMSAPKAGQAGKSFTLEGRVVSIDQKARTLLVDDQSSDKLYLVTVPEGRSIKIKFGLQMNLAEARFDQVRRKNIVRIECKRSATEHLAQLEDGTQAIVVIVSQ
ncbi:MAG: hypothetical protein AABO41_01045 [Acidobacteriota bacterium]